MIEATAETASYWEALRDGRLTALQCARCDHVQPTPRAICRCGASEMRQIDLPGEAELVSYTVASYAPPDLSYLPSPYTIGILSFPALQHQVMALVDASAGPAAIGDTLSFSPFRSGDVVLPQFATRPAVQSQDRGSHDRFHA